MVPRARRRNRFLAVAQAPRSGRANVPLYAMRIFPQVRPMGIRRFAGWRCGGFPWGGIEIRRLAFMPRQDAIFILGASGTGLALLRDAVKLGFDAYVVDRHKGPAFDSRYGRKILDASADLSRTRALLREVSAERNCWLIASSDTWLEFVQAHRPWLEGLPVRILHPSARIVETCLSKIEFARFCREQGFPTPLTWFVGAEARPAGLELPLILRPTRKLERNRPERPPLPKAREIRDEAEVARWLDLYPEQEGAFLLSHSLLGRDLVQLSVPFVRTQRECTMYVAEKIRPKPADCEVGIFVRIRPDAQAAALAEQVITRLDYWGIGEVEILRDRASGEYFLIEINPRPWSQYSLSAWAGFHFLGTLTGRGKRRRGPPPTDGAWIDVAGDIYYFLFRRRTRDGRVDPTFIDYLRQLRSVRVLAHVDLLDPWPVLSATLRIGRRILGRRAGFARRRRGAPGGSRGSV